MTRAVLVAIALGLSAAAYAQDPSAPLDPSATLLVELARAGGLPSVLAIIAYHLGKGGIPVSVTVRLSEEDRAALSRLVAGD